MAVAGEREACPRRRHVPRDGPRLPAGGAAAGAAKLALGATPQRPRRRAGPAETGRLLSSFRARTGRNQPSNTRFIFGPSVWLRGLIKPPPGHGVAYIDWSQQEFGIAAALSGDPAMLAAYRSGDPYLAFAKQAGAVPADATKETHGPQRELFKQCVLGVQYGMGASSLALRIVQPRDRRSRSPAGAPRSLSGGFGSGPTRLSTRPCWPARCTPPLAGTSTSARARTRARLRNFPMQANGAEMLRIACCLATERGVEVCAPIHDAVLIMSPLGRLDEDIARMRAAMAEASRAVLDGFELGTDVHAVRYPDRYMDKRGAVMWERVTRLIADRRSEEAA